ncbi:DUF4153 domain-containing protein [Rhabdobacter roseus]|uniref:Membrane protein YdbS with pleckstrin-like domain n=1 Tax=Rhabdobacter roseus TaxID=1655419 RepID=A0A840TQM1_9BACT|nr:hypothetical protein [Rhabdobacter roseus]MBB5285624.1 membrane protein YdbS with pleckstrin-like domain [Rhabdobacter roseus]
MKDEILVNLENPRQLEQLYRSDTATFRQAFQALYPELKSTPGATFWHERLNYPSPESTLSSGRDLLFVLVAAAIAGTLAKLPVLFSIDEEYFYTRNIGFLVFPFLAAYFVRKNKLSGQQIGLIGGAMLLALVYINVLPRYPQSDTLLLACGYLQVLLWGLVGYAFVGPKPTSADRRLGYLRYNGDLVVMGAILLLAGGLLTAVTIGLFSLIGYQIEEFYAQYVVVFGLAAAPLVGTYLTQAIPQVVHKVSPVIARLFSPLVLVTLVVYLVAILFSGKDPYNDREFLLLFNAVLVGVMALIFFSVAEGTQSNLHRAEVLVLFLLSVVTVLVNGVALSAILFRVSAWGFTPNRAAVLGSNILILINLLLVTAQLLRVLRRQVPLSEVGKPISAFLPIYLGWAAVVAFLFPLLFGFK